MCVCVCVRTKRLKHKLNKALLKVKNAFHESTDWLSSPIHTNITLWASTKLSKTLPTILDDIL